MEILKSVMYRSCFTTPFDSRSSTEFESVLVLTWD